MQPKPPGTANAVKAAVAHIDPANMVVVLNGNHPLITEPCRRRTSSEQKSTGGDTSGEDWAVEQGERESTNPATDPAGVGLGVDRPPRRRRTGR